MADGRHFENSFTPYLSRELSDFNQIWYTQSHRCKFPSEDGCLTKNRNFSNSRWQTDAILKIVFWLYLGAFLADRREFWKRDEESHANTGHVTKIAIFQNSRWRTAAILKTVFGDYVILVMK